MTSTAKRCKPRHGYTLLEIVIVLLISSVVLAGAVGLMTFSSDEYNLKKASSELEALAKRARMMAVLKQTPYAVVFHEGWAEMKPLFEALQGDEFEALASDGEEGGEASRWELSFDNGMQVSVRRWNAEEWMPARGDGMHLWRFDPNGLCEPLGVRLWLNESSMEMAFHPLSASIRDSELEIR